MAEEDDKLPSDQEHGGLKPQPEEKPERTDAPPPKEKTEQDPFKQPSLDVITAVRRA